MVSEDRTSPRSGRARASRTIPTKSPLPCRIREFYRDTCFGSFDIPVSKWLDMSCASILVYALA